MSFSEYSEFAAHIEMLREHEELSLSINKELYLILKNHMKTRLMTDKFRDVIDFVVEDVGDERIRNCKIYSITNSGLDALEEEAKKIALTKKTNTERNLYVSMAKGLRAARAFYTLDTREIFYITDIEDRKEIKEQRKKKPLPSRFDKETWRKKLIRSAVAHELYHYTFDLDTMTRDVMLQEQYAYRSMISYCRKEGMEDHEIIDFVILPYGMMVANEQDPEILDEELEKRGREICWDIIKSFDIERGESVQAHEETRIEQTKTIWDDIEID